MAFDFSAKEDTTSNGIHGEKTTTVERSCGQPSGFRDVPRTEQKTTGTPRIRREYQIRTPKRRRRPAGQYRPLVYREIPWHMIPLILVVLMVLSVIVLLLTNGDTLLAILAELAGGAIYIGVILFGLFLMIRSVF